MVIWAPRIAEPEGSVTVPRSEVVPCPQAATAHSDRQKQIQIMTNVETLFIQPPFSVARSAALERLHLTQTNNFALFLAHGSAATNVGAPQIVGGSSLWALVLFHDISIRLSQTIDQLVAVAAINRLYKLDGLSALNVGSAGEDKHWMPFRQSQQIRFLRRSQTCFHDFIRNHDLDPITVTERSIERSCWVKGINQIRAQTKGEATPFNSHGQRSCQPHPAETEHLLARCKAKRASHIPGCVRHFERQRLRPRARPSRTHLLRERKHLAEILFQFEFRNERALTPLAVGDPQVAQ